MPIYVYEDMYTGERVEALQTVDDRDCMPNRYRRLMPERIGVIKGIKDPRGAERSVPRALRDLELQGKNARHIAKEAGHSVDDLKQVWDIK